MKYFIKESRAVKATIGCNKELILFFTRNNISSKRRVANGPPIKVTILLVFDIDLCSQYPEKGIKLILNFPILHTSLPFPMLIFQSLSFVARIYPIACPISCIKIQNIEIMNIENIKIKNSTRILIINITI